MAQLRKLLFPLSSILLLAASCGKDYNSVGTRNYDTYASMEEVFSKLEAKPKSVTIDAAAGGTFYGSSGTKYVFQPNSLVDAAGHPLGGNVQLEVTEYISKGDMIFSQVLPLSGSESLESGGELKVTATQNGQPIYLKPNTTFTATIPRFGDTTSGMGFFNGRPVVGVKGTKVDWVPKNDTSNFVRPTKNNDSLEITSDSLQFCNADRFMTNPVYQSFTLTLWLNGGPKLTSADEVHAYALYDGRKAMWKFGYRHPREVNIYAEDHVPSIPIHVVVFTLVKGKLYGVITPVTPVSNTNYNLTLEQVDAQAFKDQVNLLR